MRSKLLYIFSLTILDSLNIDLVIDRLEQEAKLVAEQAKLYDETFGKDWPPYMIEPITVIRSTDNPGQWPMLRMEFEVRTA